jgi:hypothetical protein
MSHFASLSASVAATVVITERTVSAGSELTPICPIKGSMAEVTSGMFPEASVTPTHCGHVGMDLAVKEIDARQVEVDRERPALRLVLIHDDVRAGGLHQKGNCVLRTSAAVIDLKIHPLTRSDYRKRGAGQLTLEPVTRLIGKVHSVNRATGSVNRAWGDHG